MNENNLLDPYFDLPERKGEPYRCTAGQDYDTLNDDEFYNKYVCSMLASKKTDEQKQ